MENIKALLEAISASDQFCEMAAALTDSWQQAHAGVESVDPILRFMEEHPSLDFGMPGPLTHYVESFHGAGYEDMLLASLDRRPTFHTVWMLNRLINGTADPTIRARQVSAMRRVISNERADASAVSLAERLSRRQE